MALLPLPCPRPFLFPILLLLNCSFVRLEQWNVPILKFPLGWEDDLVFLSHLAHKSQQTCRNTTLLLLMTVLIILNYVSLIQR